MSIPNKRARQSDRILSSYINKTLNSTPLKPFKRRAKEVARISKTNLKGAANSIDDVGSSVTSAAKKILEKEKQLFLEDYGGTSGEPSIGDIYREDGENSRTGAYDFSTIRASAPVVNDTIRADLSKYFLNSNCLSRSTPEKECTSYTTVNALETQPHSFIDNLNFRGSGWTMHNNIVNAGGTEISNIFSDKSSLPKSRSTEAAKRYIRNNLYSPEHINNLRNNLQPGDNVSLFFPKSQKYDMAWNESKGQFLSTHGGEVVVIDGVKHVRDNVGGNLRYRNLDEVLAGKDGEGVGITAAVRPEKIVTYKDLSNLGIDSAVKDGSVNYSRLFNTGAERALKAMDANKDVTMRLNNATPEDYEYARKLAHGIMFKESIFGEKDNNYMYNFTSGRSPLGKVASWVRNMTQKVGLTGAESLGFGNVKIKDRFTEEELKERGYYEPLKNNDRYILEGPEFSGVSTVEAVLQNMKKVDKLIEKVPWIKKGDELYTSLVNIGHNQGFENVEKDFYTYINKHNPIQGEVFETIRNAFTPKLNEHLVQAHQKMGLPAAEPISKNPYENDPEYNDFRYGRRLINQYNDFSYPKSLRTINSYINHSHIDKAKEAAARLKKGGFYKSSGKN